MPSTVIQRVHYDENRRVLTVHFVSGRIYDYLDVPRTEYAALVAAPSKGRYFNVRIRNRYRYRALAA